MTVNANYHGEEEEEEVSARTTHYLEVGVDPPVNAARTV